MPKIVTTPIPHDLPENWKQSDYVSPGGTEVGLSEKHGYNYLMWMVNNAHIAIEELDAFLANMTGNKNLLHNWYLRSPIDTKGGYFIPTGVAYYSSESLGSKVGDTLAQSTPNYVGSNYATFVMSGTTFYVSKSSLQPGYIGSVNGGVCIDRWHLTSNSTLNTSLIEKLNSSGCDLTLSRQTGDFYQNVANGTIASKFGGFTYTFSAKIESFTGSPVYLYITDGVATKQTLISASGIHTVSITVSTGASKFVVGIKNTHATNASKIRVSALKLEVGTKSSLINDPPADRAEQMAQCIQFDAITDAYTGFTAPLTANVLAEAVITP